MSHQSHKDHKARIDMVKALREELLQKGHVFKTHTDSEVLLHGYEEYGTGLLNKLREALK